MTRATKWTAICGAVLWITYGIICLVFPRHESVCSIIIPEAVVAAPASAIIDSTTSFAIVADTGKAISSSDTSNHPKTKKLSGKKGKGSPSTNGDIVHINTATAQELDQLDGVGEKTAQKIIEFRTENGPFKTIDDIVKVKGIGPKKFEKMRFQLAL